MKLYWNIELLDYETGETVKELILETKNHYWIIYSKKL